MRQRNFFLLGSAAFVVFAYLVDVFTGGLQRSPFVGQQMLAITVGITIGRAARVWLHD